MSETRRTRLTLRALILGPPESPPGGPAAVDLGPLDPGWPDEAARIREEDDLADDGS